KLGLVRRVKRYGGSGCPRGWHRRSVGRARQAGAGRSRFTARGRTGGGGSLGAGAAPGTPSVPESSAGGGLGARRHRVAPPGALVSGCTTAATRPTYIAKPT